MKNCYAFCILLLLGVLFHYETNAQLRTNFKVKRFEYCAVDDPICKFSGNITVEGNKQFFSFDTTIPFDLGDNVGLVCTIEHAVDGKIFIPLFTIREKNICKAAYKYMGEHFYEIQRGCRMAAGVCPMRAGRYRLHHFEMHYEKLTLQTFPFGRLRITMKALENARKKVIWCLTEEVENLPA